MNETTKEPSARKQQLDARRERVAAMLPQSVRVRVTPRDDTIRKAIAHPSGVKFPESGSVEWPLDPFTKRRLRDGTVTREDAHEEGSRTRAMPKAE